MAASRPSQIATATAAAPAAAPRRPTVPRVRAGVRDTLYTQDAGAELASGSAAQDSSAMRPSLSLESFLPPVPQSFKCPITCEVMRDPVVTQDGHVYESEAIQEWFRRGHRTSPVTGAVLANLALLPEVPLRRAIEEYMALRPEIARRELDLRTDILDLRNATEVLEQELQAKRRILSDLGSSRLAEAHALTAQNSSGTSTGACDVQCSSQHSQLRDMPQDSPSVKKGTAESPLPPVLANLPTPCRDGSAARAVRTRGSSETTSAPTGCSTKLQELMKAMRWRGRSSRSRPRSQSQDR